MTTRSLSVSDNAMLVRLDDWDEALKVFNVVQFVNMTKSDLTAQQVERDIDIEQLNCFKVRRHQPVEFRYSSKLSLLISEYDEREKLLSSIDLTSGDSKSK